MQAGRRTFTARPSGSRHSPTPDGDGDERARFLRRPAARLDARSDSSLVPDDPIAEHVKRHGDGVRDVALHTSDAGEAFRIVVAGGARPVAEPAAAQRRRPGRRGAGRDVRRHGAHVHRARRISRRVAAWISAWSAVLPPARTSACSASTTASPTSVGARWTAGATTTRRLSTSPS